MTAALVGIGSGALHAVSGPDHLLGVAPHAVTRRRGAWRVGAAWGAGHAVGTVTAASLLLAAAAAARVSVVERWAERGAGVALVAVGLLGLLALRRTLDPARAAPARAGGLLAAATVGLVHGALGAAALVALIAGVAAPGLERLLFLAGFSAGSAAAMALLTAALARAARAPRLAALLPRVPRVASALSIALGLAWIAAA